MKEENSKKKKKKAKIQRTQFYEFLQPVSYLHFDVLVLLRQHSINNRKNR